jgi:hypothetical protein
MEKFRCIDCLNTGNNKAMTGVQTPSSFHREPDRIQQTGLRDSHAAPSQGNTLSLIAIERRGGKFQQGGGSDFLKKDGSVDIEAFLASQKGLSDPQKAALRSELESVNSMLAFVTTEALDQGGVKSFNLSVTNGQAQWSFTLQGDLPNNPLVFSSAEVEKYSKSGGVEGNKTLFGALQKSRTESESTANSSNTSGAERSIAETVYAAGELGIEIGDTNPGAEMFAESVEENAESLQEMQDAIAAKDEEKRNEAKQREAALRRELGITSLEAKLWGPVG